MNPLFLVDIPEPIILLTKHASRSGAVLIWANHAFFSMGGWNPTTTVVEQVLDASEIRQVRSVATQGSLFRYPLQLEVRYQLPILRHDSSNASGDTTTVAWRRMWLYFHPLLPVQANVANVFSESMGGVSSTVFCTCSWVPSIDMRDLLYQFSPVRVNGIELDYSARDARFWFVSRETAAMLGIKDPHSCVGPYLVRDFHVPQGEVNWWLNYCKHMLENDLQEAEVKRVWTFQERRLCTRTRFRLIPGWAKPRFLAFVEDIGAYELAKEELGEREKEAAELKQKVSLLQRFFEDAPLIMGVFQLELYDPERNQFRDFVHLLSNKPKGTLQDLTGKRGSQLFAEHELEWWVSRCADARIAINQLVCFDWRCNLDRLGKGRCYATQLRWLHDRKYMYVLCDVTSERTQREELERAITERTAQLEDALQTKSRFIAAMSHELRTPLTGICGAAMLLQRSLSRSQLDEHQLELFHIVSVCSEQLSSLIEDVLDISCLSHGSRQLHMSEFSMSELLSSCFEVILVGVDENKKRAVEFINAVKPRDLPAAVIGDQRRIRQVILNLLHNATKFTVRGKVVLSVKACKLPERDNVQQFVITVQDTGPGISDSVKAKLFQPFCSNVASGSPPSTRSSPPGAPYVKPSGACLGLYISSFLIELMHGTIWYESSTQRDGSGTTFHVSLALAAIEDRSKRVGRVVSKSASVASIPPSAQSPPPQQQQQQQPPPPPPFVASCTPTRHAKAVLVAEDNEVNRKILRRLLESMGWTNLTFVENGMEAVNAARSGRYAYILMDVMMPVMDGLDATREIRRMSLSPQPRIIALTASASDEQRRACLNAGMDEHLPKPFQPKRLEEALSSNGYRSLTRRTAREI